MMLHERTEIALRAISHDQIMPFNCLSLIQNMFENSKNAKVPEIEKKLLNYFQTSESVIKKRIGYRKQDFKIRKCPNPDV